MKKPLIDLNKRVLQKYLDERGFINKFIRYWGTTTVDEQSVLVDRNYYFGGGPGSPYTSILPNDCSSKSSPKGMPGPCSRQRRLFEFLGVWDSLAGQDKDGLDSAWFFLNPEKTAEFYDEAIISNLNQFLSKSQDVNGRIKVKLKILINNSWIPGVSNEGSFKEYLTLDNYASYELLSEKVFLLDAQGNKILKNGSYATITEPVRSYTNAKNQLRAKLTDIWANNAVIAVPRNSDDIYENLITRHALFFLPEDEVRIEYIQKSLMTYTITYSSEDLIIGNNYVKQIPEGGSITYRRNESRYGELWNVTYIVPVYEVDLVIRYPSVVNAESGVGKQVLDDLKIDYYTELIDGESEIEKSILVVGGRVNNYITYNTINKSTKTSDYEVDGVSFFYQSIVEFDNSLGWWIIDYSNHKVYLKTEVLSTSKYIPKREDRIKFIQSILDSDYDEEDRGFLAVVIIIVAIVVSVFTAGAATSFIMAAATAITTFSLVIALGAMLLDSMGYYGDAMWLSRFNKGISPLVMVASIIIVWRSILNFAQNAVNTLGSAASMTAQQLMEKIADWVINRLSSMSIQEGIKLIGKAFDMWSKNELSQIQGDLQKKQKELEKYEEAKEQSKYGDIYKDMAYMLMNPLLMLGSSYEYDRPYEPIYGPIHTGCSCRTTVLGLYGEGANTYVNNFR